MLQGGASALRRGKQTNVTVRENEMLGLVGPERERVRWAGGRQGTGQEGEVIKV